MNSKITTLGPHMRPPRALSSNQSLLVAIRPAAGEQRCHFTPRGLGVAGLRCGNARMLLSHTRLGMHDIAVHLAARTLGAVGTLITSAMRTVARRGGRPPRGTALAAPLVRAGGGIAPRRMLAARLGVMRGLVTTRRLIAARRGLTTRLLITARCPRRTAAGAATHAVAAVGYGFGADGGVVLEAGYVHHWQVALDQPFDAGQ